MVRFTPGKGDAMARESEGHFYHLLLKNSGRRRHCKNLVALGEGSGLSFSETCTQRPQDWVGGEGLRRNQQPREILKRWGDRLEGFRGLLMGLKLIHLRGVGGEELIKPVTQA